MGDGVPADAQRGVVNVVGGAEDGGASAPGGTSSSSGEPSSETSACEQRREGGERRRKRRRVGESNGATSDEEYEFSEIADAINKFTEAYIKIETTKIESKKTAVEHKTRMAAMTMEMEDRRYRSMLDTQLAMAKLVAEAVKGALDRCLDTRVLRDA